MTGTSESGKAVGIGRALAAAVLALVGGFGVLVAVANLFNVDKQPAWLLVLFGAGGVAAIAGSVFVSAKPTGLTVPRRRAAATRVLSGDEAQPGGQFGGRPGPRRGLPGWG